MAEWDKAILNEYPFFQHCRRMLGLTSPESIASWQKDASNHDWLNSYLPSVFDFAMYDALRLGFDGRKTDGTQASSGSMRFLSRDFVYPDLSKIVVFLLTTTMIDRFLAFRIRISAS